MRSSRLLITLFILIPINLFSFSFSPISIDLEIEGRNSIKYFTTRNSSEKKIAIKIEAFQRDMDLNGEDILNPAKDDFFIYPKHIILEPGESQRIRVQYRGEKNLTIEKAYRIIAEEVPVVFKKSDSTGGLTILYRYVASVYILPVKKTTNIEIVKKSIYENRLDITLENSGTGHIILKDLTIIIRDELSEVRIPPEDLPGLNGSNILAGSKRDYSIKWPNSIDISSFSLKLNYEPIK